MLIALVVFGLGFLSHWIPTMITQGDQVNLLTTKVAELSVKLDKLSDKMDAKDARINNHETRISVIESRFNIQPKPEPVKLAEN